MQEKNDDFINLLPPEMVVKIIEDYLNPNELVKAALASKETFFVNAQRKLALNKKAHELSTDVAHGKQAEVEQLLIKLPIVKAQQLLLTSVPFTDYSGRTFHCTAYEYAYWAKDTHMCRMLEQQMDADTKTSMLKRCEAIEKDGLTYKQHGEIKNSKHFKFKPLKTALTHYVQGYNSWSNTGDYTAMKAAWMAVGLAQRDVPVHVINEYCRPDRSFDPRPEFDEPTLPRVLTYYDYRSGENTAVFPLVVPDSAGLGVDCALIRAGRPTGRRVGGRGAGGRATAYLDLAAVSHLDEVRTADLTLSREILRSAEPEQSRGMTY